MIRYLTVALLGAIATAVALLPNGDLQEWQEPPRTPAQLRWDAFNAAVNELNDVQGRMDLIQLHERVATEVVAAAQAGESPLIVPSAGAHPDAIENLRVSLAMNDLGRDIAIGAVFSVLSEGEVYRAPEFSTEFFAGEQDGVTYCFRHVMLGNHRAGRPGNQWPTVGLAGRRAAVREMGPCAFVQRYGLPGAELTAWINQRGHHYLDETHPVVGWQQDWSQGVSPRLQYDALPVTGRACLSGWNDLCLQDFEILEEIPQAEKRAGIASIAVGDNMYRSSREPILGRHLRPTMMTAIEADFGPEAFQDFWSSDEEIPVAFEAAFGLPLADWMRNWGREYYPDVRIGPAPTTIEFLVTGLFSLLFLYVAFRRQSIRTTND